ncbi:PREDICTED: ammonium transporter 3 member 3-like [Nelumbo nucifera]|uniref:Ammonium transporter 3 member 3-like n=1 Tax=Nelumbo nucifera TaxID=4432 RepID=A0A1U8Q809_NELNU|nr:PREDICTED: ammonium transporter 3 member 3-like [Nelumbo nucifera]
MTLPVDSAILHIATLLLLLLLLPHGITAQAYSNVTLGKSLTAGDDNTSWPSPSGLTTVSEMAATVVPIAYQNKTSSVPDWLNKGDNAWQMISAMLVRMQSVMGLVILYGSIVKKKWAVNSAFMVLYAFTAVLICWVTWTYKMSFGDRLLPFWGKAERGCWRRRSYTTIEPRIRL